MGGSENEQNKPRQAFKHVWACVGVDIAVGFVLVVVVLA